ncbi:MAG: UDP-N-acetylmuramoyl-L-alanyl-D-glutamate--2,6-diaminopimelate ligase [Bacilli bacterium]|nr:UDP-N-acetylmuramoyl-L-alanyl-D-glutamate--2,6-diaminopimelate ligase [Bacilli bacterium]
MIKYETDSRLVKNGQIFIAIKGHTVDGHDYIDVAVENGATSIIAERNVEASVPVLVVPSTEEYLKRVLTKEYSPLLKDIKLIGVTGTNGKTTTCYLIYQLLKKLSKKVGYLGTIGFYYNDTEIELNNTTPDILTLYKLLLEAKNNDVEYIVMEISSHALELERIAGLKFVTGAFTNLSQDHLDFHETMDNYLKSKLKIKNYLTEDGIVVVNGDDSAGKAFQTGNHVTIGTNGNYKILNCDYYQDSTVIDFIFDNQSYKVKINLISCFNVYNYMMSLAIIHSLGFGLDKIINQSGHIYPPKGRCESIKVGNSFAVVDYAHTPDAVEKVIKAHLELEHNRVITIVGCGGDRDPKKRPLMGNIATSLSDYVIFTNDNPRTEDPEKIMDDIVKDNTNTNYEIIFDRKDAIEKGLAMLSDKDFLLILGKGHEDYQIIGHEKIYFDDAEVVRNFSKNNF